MWKNPCSNVGVVCKGDRRKGVTEKNATPSYTITKKRIESRNEDNNSQGRFPWLSLKTLLRKIRSAGSGRDEPLPRRSAGHEWRPSPSVKNQLACVDRPYLMLVYSYRNLPSTTFSLLLQTVISAPANLEQIGGSWSGSAAVPQSAALLLQKILRQLNLNNQNMFQSHTPLFSKLQFTQKRPLRTLENTQALTGFPKSSPELPYISAGLPGGCELEAGAVLGPGPPRLGKC